MIPIIIISYNNIKYVINTINQLLNINPSLKTNILIMDNNSDDVECCKFLDNTEFNVIRNKENLGPWVYKYPDVYNSLPTKYIITDPDLQFHQNLPTNFIEILSSLSDNYKCEKIGLALDISDYDKMYNTKYCPPDHTIYGWEKQFWETKLDNPDYELYEAETDTTFCLVNKQYSNKYYIRIAGNFTAKHLPWYINNIVYNVYERYKFAYESTLSVSTINDTYKQEISTNYNIILKNKETFLISNSIRDNLDFWKNIYANWENDTFEIFDTYLNKDKIMIDIGGWIGTTAMYGSRQSKHVYCIEADTLSFNDLSLNMNNNCINNNYTLINKAIYNENNIDIGFGKNKFMHNSKLNDSTSQIYKNDCNNTVKTITIDAIINDYNINVNDISLIKVDIEGGEEYILNDLYKIYDNYNINLYVSMHYGWWSNKDLRRFTFLTEDQILSIQRNPFVSLLFSRQ
tara:strand:+ start:469 stop:1845 length:1377 start_codon:yes stop_codon:yes gene_type:complete